MTDFFRGSWLGIPEKPQLGGCGEEEEEEEEAFCCLRGEQQEAARMFAWYTHSPPSSWEGQVWE